MNSLPLPSPTLPQCNFQHLTLPNPPDIIAALLAALKALGLSVPPLPNIPFHAIPCPFVIPTV